MPDLRSEIRDAFERQLTGAPMNADLPGRVVERAARHARRPPLRLATAVAVLLALTVVGTLIFLRENMRPQPRPATTPPVIAPSSVPMQTPAPVATPTAPPTPTEPRITSYPLTGISGMAWGGDGGLRLTQVTLVDRLDASGNIRRFALPPGTATVAEIAVGPDGAMWIAGSSPSQRGVILRLTTDGSFTSFALTSSNSGVLGITAGPDGALWFTESQFSAGGGNRIGRITTAGIVTEYAVPTPNSLPIHIVRGLDGSLWFSEDGAPRIGRITTDGHVTELPLPGAQLSRPGGPIGGTTQAVAAGSDGGVWAIGAPTRTDLSSPTDRLYRVSPDGTITEYQLPGSALAMTPGAAGTFWVAGLGQLYKVEP